MRLFVAAELPREARDRVGALLADLAREVPEVRWVKSGSVHLTLKFLGEVEPSRAASLPASLEASALACAGRLPIRIRGVRAFGSRGSPSVVFIGVEEESPALARLAAAVDAAAGAVGFAREERPFRPHLTLARPKAGSRALDRSIAARAATDLGRFEIRALALFRSLLHPDGAEYVRLAEIPFGAAPGETS
ncbi:MAG: RNA 2',3'-cyclic phosphodiesterase [Acidobacteria bacterium]|nr:RNA 2',3'-cyclic phosphodiesterase [Acidobacteriota bacterium]